VTARLSPSTENCPVNFRIVGTDGYHNEQWIPSNKDGEATFFIPGGAEGVVDTVDALVCVPLSDGAALPANACETPDGKRGTPIEMQVIYTF